MQGGVDELLLASRSNEEFILDVPFTADDVGLVLFQLKKRKAAGQDGLMAVHLQEAGSSVQIWLRNILNAIVELEKIPTSLKSGIIIPVYKGSGKDPTLTDR